MAVYIGKPLVIDQDGTRNQLKGQLAEHIVMQRLIELLPSDTTIVGFPQIGRYDPDL